jgi:hypothetical protein
LINRIFGDESRSLSSSPLLCRLVPLGSKYPPQHPILEQPHRQKILHRMTASIPRHLHNANKCSAGQGGATRRNFEQLKLGNGKACGRSGDWLPLKLQQV